MRRPWPSSRVFTPTWTTRSIPAPPRTLAAAPTSGTLLATTEAGLLASSDTGSTWRPLSPPGTALAVTWADEKTIVIATTTGQLGVSSDAGATWTLNPTRIGTAEALHARRGSDGLIHAGDADGGRRGGCHRSGCDGCGYRLRRSGNRRIHAR